MHHLKPATLSTGSAQWARAWALPGDNSNFCSSDSPASSFKTALSSACLFIVVVVVVNRIRKYSFEES